MRRRHSSPSNIRSLFGLVVAVFLGAALVVFLKFAGLFNSRDFAKFDRFSVVVQTENEITLVSLASKTTSVSVVKAPKDLYVQDVTHGYGSYLFGKVFDVGQLDKRGGEVLRTTAREFFGVPVDGYAILTGSSKVDDKNAFFNLEFLLNSKTNLSLIDRFRFGWGISQIRTDKVRKRDLAEIAEKLVLPDGSSALTVDKEKMDAFLGTLFVEDLVLKENLRLQIVNSTEFPGLGARAGRILEAIGVSVVQVDSQTPSIGKCTVFFNATAKDTLTVARLAQIFGCEIKPRQGQSRTDLTLILGKEYEEEMIK